MRLGAFNGQIRLISRTQKVRESKDIYAADIYVLAHTHRKGHSEQPMIEFGGEARMVNYISVGAYKATDDYARKKGFAEQDPKVMYGSSVMLESKMKRVTYCEDILDTSSQDRKPN